jgi:hypothetical protein
MGTDPAPSTTELTEFLNDGVLDVTAKWLAGHPQDRDQFIRVSGEVTANFIEKVDRAEIIAVVRESGSNNHWVSCRKIPVAQQGQVKNSDSLFFASKWNPAYMVQEDGAIVVFPSPGTGTSGGATTTDAFKVYYVNNNPRGDDDNSVTYATSGLAFFPKDKVYLVILYASIKTLEAAAGNQIVAQDVELSGAYSQLAATFKGEYLAAFQTQQPAGAPARR